MTISQEDKIMGVVIKNEDVVKSLREILEAEGFKLK